MNDREKGNPLSENDDESERILIVDDDPSMRTALMETVRRLGYSVQGAVDGMDAIDRLARFRPWMVLTDLRMPRLERSRLDQGSQGARSPGHDRSHDGLWSHRNRRRGHEVGRQRVSLETVFNGRAGAGHRESQIGTRRRGGP